MARRRTTAAPHPWDDLLDIAARLPFVAHDIAAQLDAGGRYEMPLDDEFPFAISLFHYRTDLHTRGSTWHERLELFGLELRQVDRHAPDLITLREDRPRPAILRPMPCRD